MLQADGRKIRIYYMKIEGDCSKEQSSFLYRCLPAERRELVNRTKKEEIAKKRIYVGAFLQYVLSKESGVPVENLRYRYNQWGKPELDVENLKENVPLHFNLSHSGDYVTVAVSDAAVGIDVEYKVRNYESVAKRCFCKEEYEDIISLESDMQRERRFLEYWTMKEAYVKYVGKGLQIPLNSFLVERTDTGAEISGATGKSFFMENGYCFSVCCEKTAFDFLVERNEVLMEDLFCKNM